MIFFKLSLFHLPISLLKAKDTHSDTTPSCIIKKVVQNKKVSKSYVCTVNKHATKEGRKKAQETLF